MDTREKVLVIGATGAQGGSVARHLLDHGGVAVRALTRRPEGDAAQALRAAGAEVVRGDLADRDSLSQALVGCSAVFGVTNFYEHFDREYGLGVNLIDAVAESAVRHVVLSTLPGVREGSGGELSVQHFDNKARLEAYARERALPATFVHPSFYYENFIAYYLPQPREDGSYIFGFPQGDAPLAGASVEDLGGVVAALFEQRDRFLGRTVSVVGDELTPAAYAAAMTERLGRRIEYRHIPREVFAAFDFPGAEDTANMFDYYRRFAPGRAADAALTWELYPGVRRFGAWLEEARERFLAALPESAAAAATADR